MYLHLFNSEILYNFAKYSKGNRTKDTKIN